MEREGIAYIVVEGIKNVKRFQRKLPVDILWSSSQREGSALRATAAAYQIGDSRLARRATKKSVALAVGR